MTTSHLRVKIRATQAFRIGLDQVAAGAIVEVEPAHAAELIRARRARLLDIADLRLVLKATEPSGAGADICGPVLVR